MNQGDYRLRKISCGEMKNSNGIKRLIIHFKLMICLASPHQPTPRRLMLAEIIRHGSHSKFPGEAGGVVIVQTARGGRPPRARYRRCK